MSEASALLLAANADTRLYFQPSADFNGTVDHAISFLAWDQTSGSNGATADVTANGGSTAFSLSHSPSNALVSGLGGAAGFGENSLPAADEAKQVVDLTSIFGAQGIDFFGTHYTDVTIDNNGIVYFGGGLSVAANRDHYAFYNEATGPSTSPTSGALASWQVGPISADLSAAIAVFWADVDTKFATSASPGGNSTGSDRVYWDLDTASRTLTVTWDDVGRFSEANVPNAFQLQLIAGSNGDFDIVFRYESVTWTLANGFPAGFDAPAGFSSGNGTFVQLSSSGNPGAVATRDTDAGNTGGTGVWEWHVHNGIVTERPHVGTASVIINAVNDAAIISPASVSLTETDVPLSTGGQLTVSDVDSSATFVAQAGTTGALRHLRASPPTAPGPT